MSSKAGCKEHGGDGEPQSLHRCVFATLLALLILILLTILIIWLVLRPAEPNFYLRDVALSQFNLTAAASSSSHLLTAAAQVTLSSRNPNDRIGIYYDRMDVYAAYKGQQVTAPAALPRGYQGHHDISIWSPNLLGASVPLAQPLADALAQDTAAGVLLVHFRIDGRLRWKVGTWTSGKFHLRVNCPALLTNALLTNANANANGNGGGYKLQQGTVTCNVNV